MTAMTGLDGLKVAMYRHYPEPHGKLKVSDFTFLGHATRQDVPKNLALQEMIKLQINGSEDGVLLGKLWGDDLWIEIVQDPLSDEFCMWKPTTQSYFHDVLP